MLNCHGSSANTALARLVFLFLLIWLLLPQGDAQADSPKGKSDVAVKSAKGMKLAAPR
jgi:hypothetical protein